MSDSWFIAGCTIIFFGLLYVARAIEKPKDMTIPQRAIDNLIKQWHKERHESNTYYERHQRSSEVRGDDTGGSPPEDC